MTDRRTFLAALAAAIVADFAVPAEPPLVEVYLEPT